MKRTKMKVKNTGFHHEMRPFKVGRPGPRVSMSGKVRKAPKLRWKPVKK